MNRVTKKDPTTWRFSAEGQRAYIACRAEAQIAANADGFDRGLEANDVFKTFRHFMLPRRENRCGHELQCEVVSCENLERCQTGHGPARRERARVQRCGDCAGGPELDASGCCPNCGADFSSQRDAS
jgi:hypothetical protein